jgi:prolyl-tRNA synthetase
MIWSHSTIQTLREDSHPLLVRAGYKRGNEWLFLGRLALDKIERMLREPLDLGRVLTCCNVKFVRAGSDFVVESEHGDDILVTGTNYASLIGKAVSVARPPEAPDPPGDLPPEEFSTPGVKTIAQISEFTALPATSQMKSLLMRANGEFVLVLLRGDHQLNPMKLARLIGVSEVRPASPEEIRERLGADAGSLGPVGVGNLRIIADKALRGRRNMIAGANRNEYHLRNVTPGRDFEAEFADVRMVAEGDRCITDGGPLRFSKATAIRTAEQILAAAVEQNSDADGIVLPPAIAPFTAVVCPLHPAHLAAAREICQRLQKQGVDTLLDDRDARPGVKFKDADLIGIPYRINVGKKLAEGLVEVVQRSPRKVTEVAPDAVSIPARELPLRPSLKNWN